MQKKILLECAVDCKHRLQPRPLFVLVLLFWFSHRYRPWQAGHCCLYVSAKKQYHVTLTFSANRARCLLDTCYTHAHLELVRYQTPVQNMTRPCREPARWLSMTPQPSRPASSCFSATSHARSWLRRVPRAGAPSSQGDIHLPLLTMNNLIKDPTSEAIMC